MGFIRNFPQISKKNFIFLFTFSANSIGI